MKLLLLLAINFFHYVSNAQNTFSMNTDSVNKSTVINDTIQVKEVNGRQIKFVYKNSTGKTITIKEKDELFIKYPEMGQTYGRGNGYMIVTLFTKEEQTKFDEVVKDVKADSAKKMNKLMTRKGEPIEDLKMQDIDGNNFSINSLKGKVVVLNFWFTTCAPCIKEMPELNEIVNAYKGKDVVFLAIALDDKEKIKQFLAKRKFDYRHVSSMEINKQLEIFGWPTHIVVDKKGIIQFIEVGGADIKGKLSNSVNKLL